MNNIGLILLLMCECNNHKKCERRMPCECRRVKKDYCPNRVDPMPCKREKKTDCGCCEFGSDES